LNKTLIIVRHAHRETADGRAQDNGLSAKGRRQVRKLFDFYFKRFPESETPLFWSSPKRRCLETLLPLANKLERKVVIKSELDEQGPKESLKELKSRINLMARDLKQSKKEVTLLCSHGDWIPLFFDALLGTKIKMKKGAWAEVEFEENRKPTLTWLIQDFY